VWLDLQKPGGFFRPHIAALCEGEKMGVFILIISLIFSQSVISADWEKIEGIYAVTSKGYLDPADNEQQDSHYRIQLKGKSAKDLYLAMKAKPATDECTGGMAKNINDMQCIYYKGSNTYECHFSIHVATQKIEYGVAC
jgi:hypothetical protein